MKHLLAALLAIRVLPALGRPQGDKVLRGINAQGGLDQINSATAPALCWPPVA